MATCKDCFHNDACGGFLPSDLDRDVFDYCEKGIADEIPDIEKRCTCFVNTADVVPKSEVDNLEYTLMGVMHSVDKWLEGEELEKDEVNRAATMREKTLQIIEDAKIAAEEYQHNWQKIHDSYTADCLEHYNKGRSEVAREIFEELETKAPFFCENQIAYDHFNEELADLKKKYTNQP